MNPVDNRSKLQKTISKLGSFAPMAWLLARFGHHIDRFSMRHFDRSFIGALTGLPVIILTSKGAKSGLLRTQPVLAIRDHKHPQKTALVASYWGQGSRPGWYFNLKANPIASISENGHSQQVAAREINDAEYHHYWRLATSRYAGYQAYHQRLNGRHIPIMLLSPINDRASLGNNHEQHTSDIHQS